MVWKDLMSTPVEDDSFRDVEAAACQLHAQNKTLLPVCCYHPSQSTLDYNTRLRASLTNMSASADNQVLICGHFNFRDVHWGNHTVVRGEESKRRKFYDISQDAFLH